MLSLCLGGAEPPRPHAQYWTESNNPGVHRGPMTHARQSASTRTWQGPVSSFSYTTILLVCAWFLVCSRFPGLQTPGHFFTSKHKVTDFAIISKCYVWLIMALKYGASNYCSMRILFYWSKSLLYIGMLLVAYCKIRFSRLRNKFFKADLKRKGYNEPSTDDSSGLAM